MVCLIFYVIRIYHVLLTSAFILRPPCTCGFGIREKIRCGLRFFGIFLCGFAVFGPPLRPPPRSLQLKISELVLVPSEAFELNGIQFYSELTQESIDNVNLITKQVSICIHNRCFLGNIQDKIPLFEIIRVQRS